MWYRIGRVLGNKNVMIKLAITLLLLFIFRVVSHIPIPLINVDNISQFMASDTGFLSILNNFSGQALERLSILSLGISPYITASIVIQLLQMVLPSVKEWDKEKVSRYTRYSAIVLAFIQALALILSLRSQLIVFEGDAHFGHYLYMALVVTAGTAFAIWIGDLITKRGIGNGTSMLIVAGIVTSLPKMIGNLILFYNINSSPSFWQVVLFAVVILIYVLILLAVVYMQIAKRKIPIQYANRQGKKDSNLPIRLNSAGVIPVIFASTILSIPLTIAQFTSSGQSSGGWLNSIFNYEQPIGFIIYIILIIVFSFFYSFLTIDPEKVSENLSKNNSFIPGVRPGEDTKIYVSKLLFKITVIGTTYLVILAILPIVTSFIFGFGDYSSSITLGGTSLLIIVGVAIETTQQIETDAEQKEIVEKTESIF